MFLKEEEKIDFKFAENISNSFDVYVNDAFSASHRNHTSIIGFAKSLNTNKLKIEEGFLYGQHTYNRTLDMLRVFGIIN